MDGYFDNIDLNNDGLFEVVNVTRSCRIFTNVPGSEWGDGSSIVIEILNEARELIFREELEEFIEIDDVHIVSGSDKEFNKVFISGLNKYTFKWEKYLLEFKNGKYQMIKNGNRI